MDSETDRLSLLLLSDIHTSIHHVELVVEWYNSQPRNIDYVLLCGDYLNLVNEDPAQFNDQEANLKGEAEIAILLSPLTKLNPLIPIYYIPGNHDPYTMYDTDHKDLLPGFTNLHKRATDLRPDLQIIGFGGSITAFQDGQPIWKGFPFASDNEFKDHFSEVGQLLTKQTVLLTHSGPYRSPTTISFEDSAGQIQSGSQYLQEFLELNKPRIACSIHGHTHDGIGYRWMNNLEVVNAGPLTFGRFTVVDLLKKNNKWAVSGVHIYTI